MALWGCCVLAMLILGLVCVYVHEVVVESMKGPMTQWRVIMVVGGEILFQLVLMDGSGNFVHFI